RVGGLMGLYTVYGGNGNSGLCTVYGPMAILGCVRCTGQWQFWAVYGVRVGGLMGLYTVYGGNGNSGLCTVYGAVQH
ncbi:MAG: hypothetical protein KDD09_17600, partial [Phaeodactylibacter sp.]|nr:hypothetical protein [Phaeodactylibacter sp.]